MASPTLRLKGKWFVGFCIRKVFPQVTESQTTSSLSHEDNYCLLHKNLWVLDGSRGHSTAWLHHQILRLWPFFSSPILRALAFRRGVCHPTTVAATVANITSSSGVPRRKEEAGAKRILLSENKSFPEPSPPAHFVLALKIGYVPNPIHKGESEDLGKSLW